MTEQEGGGKDSGCTAYCRDLKELGAALQTGLGRPSDPAQGRRPVGLLRASHPPGRRARGQERFSARVPEVTGLSLRVHAPGDSRDPSGISARRPARQSFLFPPCSHLGWLSSTSTLALLSRDPLASRSPDRRTCAPPEAARGEACARPEESSRLL